MINRTRLAVLAGATIAAIAIVVHMVERKPANNGNPPVIMTSFSAASLVRPGDPVFGNPKAALTIVDFYDIRCPPCRRMNLRFNRLMESDHDVRYVPVDFPILGKPSVLGTRALFAAALQNKYQALRHILMRQKRKPTMDILEADAKTVGINWQALHSAMNGPVVTAQVQAALARGHGLGLKYVPSWYIGHQRIIGSISYAELVKTVDQAERQQNQAATASAAGAGHKS